MPKVKCEICGITNYREGDQKRLFMAQFPLDVHRCRQWVRTTGKEDLAYVPIEKLHQLKYVCGKHFRPKDFKKKKTQLKKSAIPCIGITAQPLSEEILKDFPLHIAKTPTKEQDALQSINFHPQISLEHSYAKFGSVVSHKNLHPQISLEHSYSKLGSHVSHKKPSTSSQEPAHIQVKGKRSSSTGCKVTAPVNLRERSIGPEPSTSSQEPAHIQVKDLSTQIFEREIRDQLFRKNISEFFITAMMAECDTTWICKEHRNIIAESLLRRLSSLLIRNECFRLNTGLAAAEEASADYQKIAQQQAVAK